MSETMKIQAEATVAPAVSDPVAVAPGAELRASLGVTGRRPLLLMLGMLITLGFLAHALLSYSVSKRQIQRSIVENERPLTSDTIHSEIRRT